MCSDIDDVVISTLRQFSTLPCLLVTVLGLENK